MVRRGRDWPTAKQKKGTRFRDTRAGSTLAVLTLDYGEWILDYGSRWVALSVSKRQDSDLLRSRVCTHDAAVIPARRSERLQGLREG